MWKQQRGEIFHCIPKRFVFMKRIQSFKKCSLWNLIEKPRWDSKNWKSQFCQHTGADQYGGSSSLWCRQVGFKNNRTHILAYILYLLYFADTHCVTQWGKWGSRIWGHVAPEWTQVVYQDGINDCIYNVNFYKYTRVYTKLVSTTVSTILTFTNTRKLL